ncbi:hypothetical protein PL9214490198 [Planktothrix tepida PCC 9214]|uniref:Uncharacterized protein n=1 Tax=Planktothrix tepida PCC 9214 TaxID=671072 RepID=A0A1J1LJH8_9CYAN|nr:hypothetical protein PL9214490198 [Planktothrix tepida PCC 9214]
MLLLVSQLYQSIVTLIDHLRGIPENEQVFHLLGYNSILYKMTHTLTFDKKPLR